jgi:hypothetical protein
MKNDKFYGSYYELEVGKYLVKKLKDKNFYKIFSFFISKFYLDQYIKKQIKSNYSVLNIGSGYMSDFNLYKLLKKKITIIDCSKNLIIISRKITKKLKLSKINFINKSVFNISNKKKFDYVVCANLLNIFTKKNQKKLIKKLSLLSCNKIHIEIVNFYSLNNILYTLLRLNFIKLFVSYLCKYVMNFFISRDDKNLKKMKLFFFLKQFLHDVPNKRYYYHIDFYKSEFQKYDFFPQLIKSSFNRQILIFKKTRP